LRCTGNVRLAFTLVLLGMLTAPAVACPPREACMVAMKSTIELPQEQATTQINRVIELRLDADKQRPAAGDVEMPWIWRALRDQVYSRMPTYEKQDDDLKLTLAPVVVTSPSDTVPGLGIAGDF
jgi:hypothetical protein